MSLNRKLPNFTTQVVCSDGSTINIDFPYKKSKVYLTNDLRNNISYVSPLKLEEQSLLNENLQRGSNKKFGFGFLSLLDKKA